MDKRCKNVTWREHCHIHIHSWPVSEQIHLDGTVSQQAKCAIVQTDWSGKVDLKTDFKKMNRERCKREKKLPYQLNYGRKHEFVGLVSRFYLISDCGYLRVNVFLNMCSCSLHNFTLTLAQNRQSAIGMKHQLVHFAHVHTNLSMYQPDVSCRLLWIRYNLQAASVPCDGPKVRERINRVTML